MLTRDEVQALLRVMEGTVALMAGLMYGGGLRLMEWVQEHLARVKAIYEQDRADCVAGVYLWPALARKYPKAPFEWIWQYVFPARGLSVDPRSGLVGRHHINENLLQKAVKSAASKAGIHKRVSCHVLRHFFATHLLEAN